MFCSDFQYLGSEFQYFSLSVAVLMRSKRQVNKKWSMYLITEMMCVAAGRILVPVYVS